MACLLTGGAFLGLAVSVPQSAQAAKQWDPYMAISFTVSGTDDPIAPSNVGANGLQISDYSVTNYDDVDHWIDPDESQPNNEGYPDEQLPYSDIDTYTDAPSPGGISGSGPDYTYTAPGSGGTYTIGFTGTDRDQVIGPGESGNRNDPDNTDNWWELDDPNAV
jgi:hypothetical protein